MSKALIQLKEITKTYTLGEQIVHALQRVDIEILATEYVALMGPSGSGKSTLMNIIGCLDSPTSGEYWLNNKLVSRMTDAELSTVRNDEIGFVFQTFNLLGRLSAQENVALPLVYAGISQKERTERAAATLEKVGLKDRMLHKPNELSGGQRQRVAVARALINNPSLLLADEPTGNLDPDLSTEIMYMFEEFKHAGTSLLIATHDIELVHRFGYRVITLDKGHLIAS